MLCCECVLVGGRAERVKVLLKYRYTEGLLIHVILIIPPEKTGISDRYLFDIPVFSGGITGSTHP